MSIFFVCFFRFFCILFRVFSVTCRVCFSCCRRCFDISMGENCVQPAVFLTFSMFLFYFMVIGVVGNEGAP